MNNNPDGSNALKPLLITNIQRFSLKDGPGIRTTVFLKGCSLACPWCSNPENISPFQESFKKNGLNGIYGKFYTTDELTKECLKDKTFYEGTLPMEEWSVTESKQIDLLPGGVTFSGGEALLKMEALQPVCENLHREGVHIAVETCLFVPEFLVRLAASNIDLFYVDIKIMDKARCRKIEKGNLELYLRNLKTLFSWTDQNGNHKPVVIRIPVIGSYTDDTVNRENVKNLVSANKEKILKVELIKEHNLGESKYNSLGRTIDYHGVSDSIMEEYKNELNETGIEIEICKI